MPTYMLEGQTAVRLTPKPLTISLQMTGPVQGRLIAMMGSEPIADAVRPRPELLILPTVTDTVTLRIEPVGADVFPQGARGNVSVSVNEPGAVDPERAVLPPLDLAGLSRQTALSIARGDDGLRVRSEVREAVRITLNPLGDAARVVATELVGRQRLDDDEAIDVVVAVDASASFRRQVAAGQLRRVVDVVEGIAAVIDPDRRAEGHVLTATGYPVTTAPGRTLAAAFAAAFDAVTPETGAALASGATSPLRGLAAHPGNDAPRRLTYVITDAAPADRSAFESLGLPGRSVAHLVVIGRGSAWRLQRGPDVPTTLFDLERIGAAPADPAAADPLATQLPALRPLVADLLRGRPE
ncbi:hypothetical protein GCM10011490_01620 [Pseudoclavibacter endophyticus]|uniref:VWA domain-containing protein n=1 Tax=Pseudoclavibacter endophyticus TaxID=1778590 RepID=A0A6H9WVV0_9MICO|nr:hypothetical protein [Pseudoclavibacter endophyticus]KAB1650290.1 hypothetical protein F8O04_08895 [Pseudoclavibacter endophyticus]GGA55430.1 hypothetical protein GCM10011490_01620 [Pseudoclavibacter endophyticus]